MPSFDFGMNVMLLNTDFYITLVTGLSSCFVSKTVTGRHVDETNLEPDIQ